MSNLNRNVTIGGSQFNPADLLQSYMNAVTKPNVSTYEAEMPKASWIKVLVGVALVAVVGFIVNLIFASAAASTYNTIIDQLRAQGNANVDQLNNYRWAFGGGSAFGALISPFITFFLGAAVQYALAKMLGGQGNDFMVHSYLLSISYTPLRVVASILNIIPVAGGCVGFLLSLYQIYSAGLSMQASQRLQPGRAQLAAWIPLILLLVLFCGCAVLFLGLLGAAIGGSQSNP